MRWRQVLFLLSYTSMYQQEHVQLSYMRYQYDVTYL